MSPVSHEKAQPGLSATARTPLSHRAPGGVLCPGSSNALCWCLPRPHPAPAPMPFPSSWLQSGLPLHTLGQGGERVKHQARAGPCPNTHPEHAHAHTHCSHAQVPQLTSPLSGLTSEGTHPSHSPLPALTPAHAHPWQYLPLLAPNRAGLCLHSPLPMPTIALFMLTPSMAHPCPCSCMLTRMPSHPSLPRYMVA